MRADEKQVGGDHYKGMAIQPSEYIYRNKLGWYEGNAVKYITRHGVKGGRKDIEKAIHYLELLLEAEYGTPTPSDMGAPKAECYNPYCECDNGFCKEGKIDMRAPGMPAGVPGAADCDCPMCQAYRTDSRYKITG